MLRRQLRLAFLGTLLLTVHCGGSEPAAPVLPTPAGPDSAGDGSEPTAEASQDSGGTPASEGSEAETSSDSARDQSSATAVVESFLANLRDGHKDGALALGIQEWQANEMAARGSFLNAIFDDEVSVKQWEIGEIEAEEEYAKVNVRALLVEPDGGIDNEPMRFTVMRIDGVWWISDLN